MLLEEVSDHNGFKDDRKRVTFLLIVSLTNLSQITSFPRVYIWRRDDLFSCRSSHILLESESGRFDIYLKVKVLTYIGK